MSNAIVTIDQPPELLRWDSSAHRGLAARRAREVMISSVLKPGLDYGVIPGTEKPTLLKAGAEKIADSLDLYPEYKPLAAVEDFDRGIFFYRYECSLRLRGGGQVISTGIGSANSREARYRWRNAERKCPVCEAQAIIKGKEEYGGGWVCFKKKGGCGAKFSDKDPAITGQAAGKVENDDPYTLTNTVDKMAQKRSLVAASLNLGFSEHFTQDIEDMASLGEAESPAPADPEPTQPTLQDVLKAYDAATDVPAFERARAMAKKLPDADKAAAREKDKAVLAKFKKPAKSAEPVEDREMPELSAAELAMAEMRRTVGAGE